MESIPFRDGRQYYKKIRLSFKNYSDELANELNRRRKMNQEKVEVYQESTLNELEHFLEKKYQNILNYLSPSFSEILNKEIFYDLLDIMSNLDQNLLLKELAKYELDDVFQ